MIPFVSIPIRRISKVLLIKLFILFVMPRARRGQPLYCRIRNKNKIMETNQNTVQEQSAHDILATTAGENPDRPSETLYDPARAAAIADTLRELLDPEYILLFGKLARATPHSDVLAYDLLVITDGPSHYGWYDAKRYLKMKLPYVGHGAPYANLYIHTCHDVESNIVPFFHLARREGILLYGSHRRKLCRPRNRFDFGRAASAAERYAAMFMPLADRLADYAERNVGPDNVRESAFAAAQAVIYYYRTLFYVYHGFEADSCDVKYLHHRMRTLSGELLLLFEPDDMNMPPALHRLKWFAGAARYDPKFFVETCELARHVDRVRRLGQIVKRLCRSRVELYDRRTR